MQIYTEDFYGLLLEQCGLDFILYSKAESESSCLKYFSKGCKEMLLHLFCG